MKALIAIAIFLLPSLGLAAPWCFIKDEKENCRFYTAEQCYDFTVKGGGTCKPNPREFGVRGGAPWCVITAGARDCGFRSKSSCLAVARSLGPTNAGCVRNTELDLKRRAAGQDRIASCSAGDQDCEGSGTGFSLESGLEAAGYGAGP